MATTSSRTSPKAFATRVAKRVQRSPGSRPRAWKERRSSGSAREACDSIPEERRCEQDEDHERDRTGMALEPAPGAVEQAARPGGRDEQREERERERQQGDEREEQPLDHVA